MKVLGLGNALVDVLAVVEEDTCLERLNLPKGSMQLIDEQKLEILNTAIENIDKFLAAGGSASNTITSMAKLGIETGFIGKIGTDVYGQYYKNDLQKHGVKLHLIESSLASGVATTFISKDGERTFGTYLGAAATLVPDDLDESIFDNYQYLYIEGYLVQNFDLVRKALVFSKKAGHKVILDLASYNVVEDNREFLLEIITEFIDILFANRDESYALLQVCPRQALEILSKQVEIAIVKDGANGSWIHRHNDVEIFIPTDPIKRIDTTGAGDLYAAGFLYGLIKGLPLTSCGRIGTLLAQQVIQIIGTKLEETRWDEIKKSIAG
jgi:sugar/nucleoside kinase (ribokinase family)